MRDPFKIAAKRIFERQGVAWPCIVTRISNGERIACRAVLDKEVELIDELGQIVDRQDMIHLLVEDVGVVNNRDTVTFIDSEDTYTLGRTIRDDGFVVKKTAQRNG